MVRDFLTEHGASLDDIIMMTGFERNAAIAAAKEAANENDETRKRFEVMCREVFKKFKACINVRGVNEHRPELPCHEHCLYKPATGPGSDRHH